MQHLLKCRCCAFRPITRTGLACSFDDVGVPPLAAEQRTPAAAQSAGGKHPPESVSSKQRSHVPQNRRRKVSIEAGDMRCVPRGCQLTDILADKYHKSCCRCRSAQACRCSCISTPIAAAPRPRRTIPCPLPGSMK